MQTAEAPTLAPVWKVQRSLPVAESKASKWPFASPAKTIPPAVARTPPTNASLTLVCQTILPPFLRSMAVSSP